MVTVNVETPSHDFILKVSHEDSAVLFQITGSKYIGVNFAFRTSEDASAEEQYYYLLRVIGTTFFKKMSEAEILSNLYTLIHTVLKNWEQTTMEANIND